MDYYDIVGALKTQAATNKWLFLYGEQWMQNISADDLRLMDSSLVLACDPLTAQPTMENGVITQIVYSGAIALGQKFTNGRNATLEETHLQKWETRLKDLSLLLLNFIAAFGCANELDTTGITFRLDMNKFDTNIDFVAATITFTQYP